ncbi:MAG: hypothetical protein FJ255_01905 [Phycisphaerae bacterium]|nr:hypothetical protein [Phycisphaerae bacterium]
MSGTAPQGTGLTLRDSPQRPWPLHGIVSWILGPVFFGLALAMVLPVREWAFAAPAEDDALVPAEAIRNDPLRTPMGDPPRVRIGAYEHACDDCHRLFESPEIQHRPLVQHTHVVLRHGMNDNCFNCHDRTAREKLVLRTGELIGYDEGWRLCAQCHGTLYRDWEHGGHGKTMGSWMAEARDRLRCAQCHDPHSPAFPALTPLPGPRTLRMGDQAHNSAHAPAPRSPLRRRGGPSQGHTPEAHP